MATKTMSDAEISTKAEQLRMDALLCRQLARSMHTTARDRNRLLAEAERNDYDANQYDSELTRRTGKE